MGRPYQEKFADIKWESNEEHFNLWKEGKTGVPIVDAGMRQLNTMGKTISLVLRFETLNSGDVELRLDAQPCTDDRCHVLDEGSYAGLAFGGKGPWSRSSRITGAYSNCTHSTSRRCSSMLTSPRTMEVGSGARELERILNPTSGYLTRTTKVKRYATV